MNYMSVAFKQQQDATSLLVLTKLQQGEKFTSRNSWPVSTCTGVEAVFRENAGGGWRPTGQCQGRCCEVIGVVNWWCSILKRLKYIMLWRWNEIVVQCFYLSVVPHEAVAEVSRIGNLWQRLVVVSHWWQSKKHWWIESSNCLTVYLPNWSTD